jgi:hypothetical protein
MHRIQKHPPMMDADPVVAEMETRSNADADEMGHPRPLSEGDRGIEFNEETRRKPIVSINGRDVDEDELDSSAA